MGHYFKVSKVEDGKDSGFHRKRRSLLSIWFSNLSVTGWLIFVNVIMFIIFSLLINLFGIQKYIFLQPYNLFTNGYFWTLLTSMFMHANIWHLLFNTISLFFVGSFLEMIIGKKRLFWLYIISGLFAGLFFASLSFLFGNSEIGRLIFVSPLTPAVGASGAIFAIAGVLCFLTPRNKVYLIAGPLIAIVVEFALMGFVSPGTMTILDVLVNIYIFISIFSMFSINNTFRKISLPIRMPFWLLPIIAIVPLIIVGLFVELPIGNTAHLGGFFAGAAYGIYLRLRYKKKSQIISNYFSR
ncbi:MAG: rhomboid family intramembrane serine protease [Nanoarchaeota archaeon]